MNAKSPEIDIEKFLQSQRRRDFRQAVLLGFFSLMFLASLGVAVMAWLQTTAGFVEVILPIALTLVAGILLARQWRALLGSRHHYRDMAEPMTVAVNRISAATRNRIREYRLVLAGIFFAMLPVFLLAALQLQAQGKMSGTDVISFMILVGVACTAVFVVLRHRIRHQLEPELEFLDSLRDQL